MSDIQGGDDAMEMRGVDGPATLDDEGVIGSVPGKTGLDQPDVAILSPSNNGKNDSSKDKDRMDHEFTLVILILTKSKRFQ